MINLNTPEEPITEIHQMSVKQFVDFINALKYHLNGTKLNLKDLNAVERVDGFNTRMLINGGQIKIESANPDIDNIVQNHLGKSKLNDFIEIAKNNRTYYSITGELFYLGDEKYIDPDGSVTFVATKYDGKKLGKIATFVIFDIKGIKGGSFYELSPSAKQNIINQVLELSDVNFKIYSPEDFTWDREIDIDLNYNTAILKKVFETPEILLDIDNRKLFVTIRSLVADAFSREISKQGSVIGLTDTEVKGIIFEIEGNKYGAMNFSWKESKNKIHRFSIVLDEIINGLFQSIFGCHNNIKIRSLLNEPDANIRYTIPWRKELPKAQEKIKKLIKEIQSVQDIPRAILRKQMPYIINKAEQFLSLTRDLVSLKQFLK